MHFTQDDVIFKTLPLASSRQKTCTGKILAQNIFILYIYIFNLG